MVGNNLTATQERLLKYFYKKSPANLQEILSSLKNRQCGRKVLSSIKNLEAQRYIQISSISQPEEGIYNIWYEITARGRENLRWQGHA